MVVYRESFLGELIIELPRAQPWVRGKGLDELKAQAAGEHAWLSNVVASHHVHLIRAAQQAAIVLGGKRIALRDARCGAPLAVGANENVIALLKDAYKAL